MDKIAAPTPEQLKKQEKTFFRCREIPFSSAFPLFHSMKSEICSIDIYLSINSHIRFAAR